MGLLHVDTMVEGEMGKAVVGHRFWEGHREVNSIRALLGEVGVRVYKVSGRL